MFGILVGRMFVKRRARSLQVRPCFRNKVESLHNEPRYNELSQYNELNIWSLEFWLTNSL